MAAAAVKTIVIVGATGTQGFSVAKTFLTLDNWKVRCVTRNPTSKTSVQLQGLGAEIVQGDLEDGASLSRAFAGAHAIFVNTDFWAPYRTYVAQGGDRASNSQKAFDVEVTHAKNAAIAAASIPTLEKYVYSALGPMNEVSGGRYSHSYHWETKAAAVKYIEKEMPELNKKMSTIYIGAYNDNPFLLPKWNEKSARYEIVMPAPKQTKFPIIDVPRSTGSFVRALVEDEVPGTKLLAYDSFLSVGEIIEAWSRVTGHEADFVQLTLEEAHQASGLPYEILDGPGYLGEYGYTDGIEGVIGPDKLRTKHEPFTFEEFLSSKDKEFLLQAEFPRF